MKRVVLITGSTDGIGKQTALNLAQKGYHVIVHGRNQEKVDEAVRTVQKATGNPDVEGIIGDLASLGEVDKMAGACQRRFERLDRLINNAGIFQSRLEKSVDGYEMTFAVNYLAHFLLTRKLLPLLKKSDGARIVVVSSMAHASAIDFDNLQAERSFDGYEAYSVSKLCNILFVYKLSRDLKQAGITVNCLHPGVINTKLLQKGWGGIGADVKEGAKTSVYLTDSPDVVGVTGRYFVSGRPARSTPVSYDISVQERLWRHSERLCMGHDTGKEG